MDLLSRPRAASVTAPSFVRSATNSSASAQTLTITGFDCSGGNFLVVVAAERNGTLRQFTTVTANGGAQACSTNMITNLNSSVTGRIGIWSLANPTTGDITVSLSGGAATQGFHVLAMLFNTATSTNIVDGNFSTSARTSMAVTSSTAATDLMVSAGGWVVTAGIDASVGAGETIRGIGTNATGNTVSLIVSTKPSSGATTTTTVNLSGAGAVGSQVTTTITGQ